MYMRNYNLLNSKKYVIATALIFEFKSSNFLKKKNKKNYRFK